MPPPPRHRGRGATERARPTIVGVGQKTRAPGRALTYRRREYRKLVVASLCCSRDDYWESSPDVCRGCFCQRPFSLTLLGLAVSSSLRLLRLSSSSSLRLSSSSSHRLSGSSSLRLVLPVNIFNNQNVIGQRAIRRHWR